MSNHLWERCDWFGLDCATAAGEERTNPPEFFIIGIENLSFLIGFQQWAWWADLVYTLLQNLADEGAMYQLCALIEWWSFICIWSFKRCKILKYGLPRKVHQVARSEQKKSTSSGQSFNLPQAGNGFWRMKGPVRREVRGGQRGEGRAILSQMRRLRWSMRRRRKRGRRRAWQSWAEESH